MIFHGRSLETLSTVVKDLEGMWPQDIKAVVEEVLKGRQFEGALAIPEPSLRMGKLRITVGLGDQTAAPPVKPHPTMLAAHKRGEF
jgi:hypothetical protein|eukprot:COSAG06_NODE_3596_length_5138_cov_7.213534_9_plen_86_part_00